MSGNEDGCNVVNRAGRRGVSRFHAETTAVKKTQTFLVSILGTLFRYGSSSVLLAYPAVVEAGRRFQPSILTGFA